MQKRTVNLKKAPKGTFSRLFKYVITVHKFKLILVIFSMILSTLTNVIATYIIQYVVKEAGNMISQNSTDFTPIVLLILLMIASYAISIVFAYIYLKIMINIGQDTLVRLREDMFNHMMGLPIKYFDMNKHGDIMSRYTNDVDATRQMISQSLPQLIISVLTIIGYLIAMFITSYILALITVVIAFLSLYITKVVTKNSKKYFKNQQQSLGKVNGYIEEMIEGQKVVKVFRHEKKSVDQFTLINEELYQNARRASIRTGMLIPITVNLGYLGFAVSAVSGALLITYGLLAIPQLVSFLLFTRNFTSPLNQISQQSNFVSMALAGAGRIFELLDEKIESNEGTITLVSTKIENEKLVETTSRTNIWAWKKPLDKTLIRLEGDVRFKDVTFGYNENKPVLKNVSLYAKPGQKIAFVGATGAGKTTITNLINRFYDIQEGSITYDGIDIKEIDKSSLRRSLGIVLQDTNLFTGTVYENIGYGNLLASKEEIIEASKLANAHDFITKLPMGYDTMITDNGANLSAGQRQLLSIARAAVANPPVLILDEATSSIDTHTEKLIQNGMDELMKGRTVFVIAHRLSTIKNAKAIIVLEQGQIIERGAHEDLIDNKGKYYQLYTGAFELE